MALAPPNAGRLAGGLLAAAVLLAAGAAHAERKVVVLPIKNADTPTPTRQVAALVDDRFELLSWRSYRDAARSLDAKLLRPSHVSQVARRIDADVVVHGTVVESRGRHLLKLRIRSGLNGEVIKKYAVALRGERMSDGVRRTLSRKLTGVIKRVRPNQRAIDEARSERRAQSSDTDRRRSRAEARRSQAETRAAKRSRDARRARAAKRSRDARRARAVKRSRDARRARAAKRSRDDRRARAAKRSRDDRRARAAKRSRDDRRARAAKRSRDDRRARARAERSSERATKRDRSERRSSKRTRKRDRRQERKPVFVEKTDENGNVIDEEVPDVLRK